MNESFREENGKIEKKLCKGETKILIIPYDSGITWVIQKSQSWEKSTSHKVRFGILIIPSRHFMCIELKELQIAKEKSANFHVKRFFELVALLACM